MPAMASQEAPAPLRVHLFGPFEVHLAGRPLPRLRSRKGHWLLALLLLRHGAGAGGPLPVERAWLAGALWPDSDASQGLAYLRSSLLDLRRALGSEVWRIRSPSLQTLAPDASETFVDVVAFDAAVARGDAASLAEAVSLYRGPLLEDCAEEWVFQERSRREQAYLQALETLAAAALEGGERGEAERHLRRAVSVDPLRESAQRALMQALASGGNYAAATQIFRELRLLLHRELNAEPDPETLALYERIRVEAREKAATRARPAPGGERPSAFSPSGEPRAFSREPAEGILTFLLTDVEGSTKLWLQHLEAMRRALARHDALAAAVIQQHHGILVKQRGEGDSLFAVFGRATDAVAAALELQRALATEVWPADLPLKVRVALHTGEAEVRDGDYYGPVVNHCARLRAVGHGGQILLSQTTAALVRETLPERVSLRDLGAHRLKDLQRAEPIFQMIHPDLPAEFPPLRSLEAFAHNLPVQLTSFIGREEEIREVRRLLTTAHLLTLTGAGGCGKTRLALQVAADLVEEYADGIWLVELAALSAPSLLAQTVASALGVREGDRALATGPRATDHGRSLTEALTDALRQRSLLLVLDNCEHLLPACAPLADRLLRACPDLRILATSREGLGLLGEQTYRVPPLSLPDPGQLPPLERVQEFEAVGLFVDRAILCQPTFRLTSTNAPAIVQLCHRLDGIPLAIELAAARVKALPVEKLVEKLTERLDDRFRLLTGGSRTALPRHQTLQALIDWSYDLLYEPERTLLRRLSVFAGGWTLEAAETVCGNDERRTDEYGGPTVVRHSSVVVRRDDVLDLLTSLVEKSLVVYEEYGGEARYRLLETIRLYAWERLVEADETEVVRGRHRDWFLALAEQADKESWGREPGAWLERLETEHDNLRAALEWSGQHEPEGALRLAGSLWRFWLAQGYLGEGRERLGAALRGAEGRAELRRGGTRARALDGAGTLAYFQGDYSAARSLLEESLTLFRELEDQRGIALCLTHLGRVAYFQGDYSAARSLLEESLARLSELGEKGSSALALIFLGRVAHEQGDYSAARSLIEKSLTLFRERGDKGGIAHCLNVLGHIAYEQGDYSTARSLLEESLTIRRDLGGKLSIPELLESLARSAAQGREWERAARLWGAAAARREAIGAPRSSHWREEGERGLGAARAALGEEAFAVAWAEGQALPLDEAIAYALAK